VENGAIPDLRERSKLFSTGGNAVERFGQCGNSDSQAFGHRPSDPQRSTGNALPTQRYFHLHLVSDATGETLINVARAAAAQYAHTHSIEHIHSLVRTQGHVEKALQEVEKSPGIVLYTLVDTSLAHRLEAGCRLLGVPSVSVLDPVLAAFQSYLGTRSAGRVGAQHVLDAEYFRRIDALNFSLAHDDGQHAEAADEAEVVLVGVSRTSKTPTAIYLANRGVKTANLPLVLGTPVPEGLLNARKPLIVGLVASPDRIVQIRQHRVLAMKSEDIADSYVDRAKVTEEIAWSRKLCARQGWPVIDVTRRSIEETAAAVISLLAARNAK
jgi:regulator of PEP synthase PpsR (kinase-PPPase family)